MGSASGVLRHEQRVINASSTLDAAPQGAICAAFDVPAGLNRVDASWRHTVALLKDGTINAFGDNDDGRCNVPADV